MQKIKGVNVILSATLAATKVFAINQIDAAPDFSIPLELT